MQMDDIKDPELKKLFAEIKHASGTIENDAEDALDESIDDEELINNWQSKLDNLYEEVGHYWGALEQMKSENRVNVLAGINCIRNPRIKCHQKAISVPPECVEHPSCLMGIKCNEKGL